MAEYDINEIFEPVILKIGDNKFKLRERTKTLGAKVDPIQKQLVELPADVKDPEVAELTIELIDTVLVPVEVEGVPRRHAKTVLAKAYAADEIGLDRLQAISEFLSEKFGDRRRPTSALLSDG
jgi:hypothetical protein